MLKKEEREKFSKICKYEFVKDKYGYRIANLLYSLNNSDIHPLTLNLNLSAGRELLEKMASVLFGDSNKYVDTRKKLDDENSKKLFDLEVLQQALIQSGWTFRGAALVVNTGITEKDWMNLCDEVKERKDFPNLIDRYKNDPYIIFSKVAIYYLNQYEYENYCFLRKGEIFFDCGACFGDTAIWAAQKVGREGKVYAFEPVAIQCEILDKNIKLNQIETIVSVEKFAVSDKTGGTYLVDDGEASFISNKGKIYIETVTIDEFCKKRNIVPDFIKMDIEGSELKALNGAENIIGMHAPKLAVCVYHKPNEDLWKILQYLNKCVPEYRFYLKKSHWAYETVLFAVKF